MIYVGIDDTDTLEHPGTNQLARHLAVCLADRWHTEMLLRFQLLVDPRVPCTRRNGCAAMLLRPLQQQSLLELGQELQDRIVAWCPPGSDPGLCVAPEVPQAVTDFGLRCQRELLTQAEARNLARQHDLLLMGLGGTEDGVIGALSAVGLAATRHGARVVHIGAVEGNALDVTGWQSVSSVYDRGVARVECQASGQQISSGWIDVGKRLRPYLSHGQVVVFAEREPSSDQDDRWLAIRRV